MLTPQSNAQTPGSLDPTYAQQDEGFGFGNGFVGPDVFQATILSDGRILVIGGFFTYDRTEREKIAILMPDGRLDPSFETVGGVDSYISAVARQSDGKFIIVGSFSVVSGVEEHNIARLNIDGSLDTTFNAGDGVHDAQWNYGGAQVVALQTDGKILVGGQFTMIDSIPRKSLARLNSDGSLDTTFSIGSGFDGYQSQSIRDIQIQPDGKILVGGEFFIFNGDTTNFIVRLNMDGSRDASFVIGSGFTRYGGNYSGNRGVRKMALLPDGRIALVGEFDKYQGITRWRAAILHSDGSLDGSFTTGTGFQQNAPQTMAMQPDGKMIVAHEAYSYNGIPVKHLSRLNPNGSLDLSFDPYVSPTASVALQGDGRIIACGYSWQIPYGMAGGIVRLMPDGSLDHGFAHGSGATQSVMAMAQQQDGKLLISGYFKYFDGHWSPGIARVNNDGTRDSSFEVGEGINGVCEAITVQPNGKILLGGIFHAYNGREVHQPIRIDDVGALDTTFISPLTHGASLFAMTLQPDGKVIVGNQVSPWVGSAHWGLTRLDTDGSEDTTFRIGTGTLDLGHYPDSLTDYFVSSTVVQPDGKIIVGGSFRMMNDTTAFGLVRLLPNGSIDTAFHTGTGFADPTFLPDSVIEYSTWQIIVQPDGKILVSGYFSYYNGQPCHSVVRLFSNGALDTTFNAGSGAQGGYGVFMRLQPDGRIIVAHDFDSFNGFASEDIVRLESDGVVDQSFTSGVGCAYPDIEALTLQPDGRILIGGSFECYDGIGRNRLARLMGGDIETGKPEHVTDVQLLAAPNPTDGLIQFTGVKNVRSSDRLQIRDMTGMLVRDDNYRANIDLSGLPAGVYSIELPDRHLHTLVIKR